ncbi:histamine H2 receptor-like [Babylonia areolata]|uniref:histamine H2 receptor-like n=1 Tax=Babylonia areolata TaxID=304850 RepID=UPI003FCF9C0C
MTDMDDHCNRTSTGPGKLDELMINIEAALIVPVLVGNLLIMASVIAFRNMKTAGNILICNLALADFLVGALYLPFDIWFMVHSRTSVTSVTCSWRTSLWDSLLGTSVLNLTLISFDRFTAVCHPFYYYLVTVDRVLSACVVAWCPMTVMSFMPMFGWNRWELCPKPAKCNQRYTHTAE